MTSGELYLLNVPNAAGYVAGDIHLMPCGAMQLNTRESGWQRGLVLR